jgi:tetratricopeptide (TPR) repeat protein
MARQSVDQVLLRAKALHKAGDTAAARQLCQDLLAEFPGNLRLRQMLDTLAAPAPAPRDAPSQHPPREALDLLISLFNRQQNEAVQQHGAALLRRFPRSHVLLNILGSAAARSGRTDQAIGFYRKALALDPGFLEVHNNLGALLKLERQWDEAAACFTKSLRLRPDQPAALRHLADITGRQDRPGLAIDLYRKALTLRHDDAAALHGLGKAQIDAGDLPGALETLQHGTAVAPADADMRKSLGVALAMAGQVEAAIAAFRETLRLKPHMASAWRALAELHRFTPGDPLLPGLEAAFASAQASPVPLAKGPAGTAPLPHADQSLLAFALAKAREDLGDLDGAFAALAEGNRLRRADTSYDIADDVRQFAALRQTAPTLAGYVLPMAAARPATLPIFIMAMPRSGTTLVEQILSGHASVAAGGELATLGKLGLDLATGARPVTPAALRVLRSAYLAHIAQRAGGKPWLTDKMPHNFRLVALIRAALPEAKILHVLRDPAAVCWSNYRTDFTSTALDYAQDLRDTVAYYTLYADLMATWSDLFGPAIRTLDYDLLTEAPDDEIRRLIADLGLPWQDACLAPHLRDRAVRTASQQQVRQAVYAGSSQSWRRYASFIGAAFDPLPGQKVRAPGSTGDDPPAGPPR